MLSKPYDIVILGAGLVGASMALTAARLGLRIALIDQSAAAHFPGDGPPEQRVSAINLQSEYLLNQLGVWQSLQRAQTYQAMRVWDAQSSAQLDFHAADIQQHHLGTLVENRALLAALHAAIANTPNIHCLWQHQTQAIERELAQIKVTTRANQADATISARLLIAADGPRSRSRTLLGIASQQQDYQQQGLVCWLRAEQGHQNTAWQRFLSGGPLAFLPLNDGLFSIVWSCPNEQAQTLANMPQDQFHHSLAEAIEYRFGAILESGPRACFPLTMRLAQDSIQERAVIIGDAAHAIHPLAGQGVNLGLADVAALSEHIKTLQKSGRDIGLVQNLRPYERQRQPANALAAWGMSAIQAGFALKPPTIAALRAELINRACAIPTVRRQLIQSAQGKLPPNPATRHQSSAS